MKKSILISAAFAYCILLTAYCFSQGTAINLSGAPADSSAILDISSTTKGMLITRMTTSQRNGIQNPAGSLMIYNTDCNCFQTYINSQWQDFFCDLSCASAPSTPGAIAGVSSPCQNSAGNAYVIAPVGGALTYNWTVPSGASVSAGQGKTGVIVDFGSSAGNVSVTATNNCGTSAASNLAITFAPGPSAPTANNAASITCSAFTANWSTVSGTTSYYLDVSTDAGFGSYITGYNNLDVGTNLSQNVSGLSLGTTYYYRVRASNSCGTSISSNTITAITHVYYVAITLTNNQSYPTTAGFQQMITVNSSAYSSYENSSLMNVMFTSGPSASGTTYQAWIESGASSSSTNTIYWVNLGSSTIPANDSLTIYMNFMGTNIMSASGPTGMAPQLSGTYGLYDNAGLVFTYYQSFGGLSAPPAGWSAVGYENITYYPSYTNILAKYSTLPNFGGLYTSAPASLTTFPFISDMYGTIYSASSQAPSGNDQANAWGTYQNTSFQGTQVCPPVSYVLGSHHYGGGYFNIFTASNCNGAIIYNETNNNFVYTIQGDASNKVTVWMDYNATTLNKTTVTASTPAYLALLSADYVYPVNVYWVRSRVYTPNGVMPSYSLGSVGC